MAIKSAKVLIGAQGIMDFLSISKTLFREFVSKGMPVTMINGRYYAHADNIENWFQQYTFNVLGDAPDEISNGDKIDKNN